MDIKLLNDKELIISHLFCHNSFYYSKPRYPKAKIRKFHINIVKEFDFRGKTHNYVDKLDN